MNEAPRSTWLAFFVPVDAIHAGAGSPVAVSTSGWARQLPSYLGWHRAMLRTGFTGRVLPDRALMAG